MDNLLLDKITFVNGLSDASVNPVLFTNNNLQVTLPADQITLIKSRLDSWNISYENIFDGELLIKLTTIDPNTLVFFKEINFRQGFENACDSNGNVYKNIALVDYKGAFLVYNAITSQTYIRSSISLTDYLIENATYYTKVLNILKSNEFADYVNNVDKEIVLYSSEKGIKRLKVPDYLPSLNSEISIKQDCITLISKLQSSDFKIYFKNELFKVLNTESITAIQEIILSLKTIIQEADNNLQLYLKNFSFEKLKDGLQKEKEKYFSSLREILGKILSQIVAVPISFAASVFATYKVNDIFILFIILGAFILYSIFTYYLQTLYLNDIKEIETDFSKDFQAISKKSGLPENDINKEKTKIERRISDIRNVIVRFRYLLIVLTIIFSIFIVYQVLQIWAGMTAGNIFSKLLGFTCNCPQ